MIDLGLGNKVVLITGANHGIGAAAAQAFAQQGARVFITYLRLSPEEYGVSEKEALAAGEAGMRHYHALQMKSADEVVARVRADGGAAEAWEVDLTGSDAIPRLFDRVEHAFGPVDIVVNNAAYSASHPDIDRDTIFTITAETIDKSFAVNTRTTVLMIAEYVHRYQERQAQWGRIVNISTDAAQTFAGQIAYGASKAAIEAFTRSIAIEVGPLGITVNTVAPGPVQTGYISAEMEEREVAKIPLQRIGQPQDIADVIVFLASQQAGWMTGNVVKVSGGHEI
jgi:3-oxoacyl-[acyl-carrier protein] reductase